MQTSPYSIGMLIVGNELELGPNLRLFFSELGVGDARSPACRRHRQPRPLLQGENPYERLEQMRQKRASLYRSIADLHMLTDGIHASAVATRIAMLLPAHLDQTRDEDHE